MREKLVPHSMNIQTTPVPRTDKCHALRLILFQPLRLHHPNHSSPGLACK
jgi:hypothetical protein